MSTPMCPVHNVPMKVGKGGGFFCTRKNGDAWCDQRVAAPKPAGSAPAPAGNGSGASPRLLLILGALGFASRVYQGTGQADDATILANSIFAAWKDDV